MKLLPTLLVLLISAAAPGGATVGVDEDAPTTVDEALERSYEAPFDAAELRAWLAELEGPVLDDLFATLVAGTTKGGRPLDAQRRLLVQTAVERSEPTQLRALLEAAAKQPAAARLEAMGILGAAGTAGDLDRLARLAPGSPAAAVVGPELRGAFAAALTSIVDREPDAVEGLGGVLRSAHPSMAAPIIDCIAASEAGEALLAGQLHVVEDYDDLLLLALAQLAERRRLELDALQLRTVRALLSERHSVTQVTLAARVVAGARDADSVPTLIDLLDGSDHVVARAARSALESITRNRLRDDVEAWRAWHKQELAWWREESARAFRAVQGRSAHAAGNAIRELSARRLHVDRVADGLLPALQRDDPELVLLACSALAQLEATTAVPALVDVLDHPDGGVRDMAWKTLRDLTDRHLPPDARLWRERVLSPMRSNR